VHAAPATRSRVACSVCIPGSPETHQDDVGAKLARHRDCIVATPSRTGDEIVAMITGLR
jgi:hypothetical protein